MIWRLDNAPERGFLRHIRNFSATFKDRIRPEDPSGALHEPDRARLPGRERSCAARSGRQYAERCLAFAFLLLLLCSCPVLAVPLAASSFPVTPVSPDASIFPAADALPDSSGSPGLTRSDPDSSFFPGIAAAVLARLADTTSATTRDRSLLERRLEELLDVGEPAGDTESEELLLELELLAAEPLNVNRAPLEELMRIPGLGASQAAAIVDHRERSGSFVSISELTDVTGIGPVTLERIAPFVGLGSAAEQRRQIYLNPETWTRNGRTELVSRLRRPLDLADGYLLPDSLGGYAGNALHHYQRAIYRSDNLSIGLIRHKRPGERAGGFAAPDGGPIHAALHDLGRLRTFVAGDYRVQFGQGLILGGAGVLGKGDDVIRSVNRGGAGVRPHTSTQAANAFRGAGLTWGERLVVTAFWSRRPRTAAEADGDSIRLPMRSPSYRTPTEVQRRYNTVQRSAGAHLSWHFRGGQIGAGGLHNRFDRPVQRGSGEWQLHDPQGHDASALSLDGRFTRGPVQLFGEAGRTGEGGLGLLAGVETMAGESTRLTLSWRRYGERFRPLFGDSFSEQSGPPGNEQGWYLGLDHRFSPSIRLRGYLDLFTFPGPRFRTRSPSHGSDWMGELRVRLDRQTELILRLRRKERGEEIDLLTSGGETVRVQRPESRFGGRVQLKRQFHEGLRLRWRVEHVGARPAAGGHSTGWMGWQDVRVRPHRTLTIDLRLTLFDTDGFDSRIYHFENDLLYAFTSTQLQDRGRRFYLLTSWRPVERVQLWFKAGATLFSGRDELGSGAERIDGNRRSEASLQMRVLL